MSRTKVKKELKVGLSPCFFHADPLRPIFKGKTLQYAEQSMARWLQNSGALTYLVPAPDSGSRISFTDYAKDLDALVLQGGSDVSPLSYGEEPLRPEWQGDHIRDIYEIELIKAFRNLGKPILGICRGLQILNVAFGGTLHQDINLGVPGSLTHRDWNIYDNNHHAIKFLPGSWLSVWYPSSSRQINSVHHQGIKTLAPTLITEAICPDDGIIEAVRYNGEPWIYAVQWHPEFQEDQSHLLDDAILLEKFLSAVHTYKREGKYNA